MRPWLIAMNMLHGKSNTGEGGESHGSSDDRDGWKEPLLRDQAGGLRQYLA